MHDTDRKDVLISVRISEGMRDDFHRLAESEHRTVSQELRRLIEIRLKAAEPLEEAA